MVAIIILLTRILAELVRIRELMEVTAPREPVAVKWHTDVPEDE